MLYTLERFFDLGFTADNVKPASSPRLKTTAAHGVLFAVAGGAAAGVLPLIVITLILLGAAALMAFLRSQRNPTYWQVACWLLVAVGILTRQSFSAEHRLDFSHLSPS